ncbi:cell division ATP-binding protein FtsE [Taylorella equigenitalis]|uniref:cell division ATP-binding protein FtsE n=1 Tax=Taylorella equigenitalis TaxID=29575 RepID=UPI000408E969|nr:ATP-binding cassette domain-containing protein [Taylorella equigenitalis]ASY29957.1 cell division ATP-binding protein FtsE [Taylorella equigenitalis]KOS59005.1 cell division protein FtsE [Taylorella equigenitalis]
MITFQHVFKFYGKNPNILADINFQIEDGEFVFISGPSGAGKSTLLKLIAGLESPSRGTITVNDQKFSELNSRGQPYVRRAIGIILQDTHLLYDRNTFENVMLPLAVMGVSREKAGARARAALEKVGLGNKEKVNPIELSGGEQQRLAIARAIVNRPKVLIADEPTANLDKNTARKILDVFQDFNRVGVTTLISSHDTDLLSNYANRTFIIEPGRFTDLGGRS